ncbi:FAD/NAD(P)-binding protein [Sphaerisporangium fuscum]|uniref:FAD/NAD(P)-binding protein n=1 Tax=Sphaerisporangium fuscum TaxID=2835868 RepID=UPI001BDC2940|nr:FAD/NAD(P)-binding protein [Sphaerisporangium fuscum]
MTGSICVVGTGPAATCLIERICAHAPQVLGRRPLDVHHVATPGDARAGLEARAPGVRVHLHGARAVDLAGRWLVLDDGTRIGADAVVLAQPRLEVLPTPREQELRGFARDHGLHYLPCGRADDLSLDHVPGGQPVLVRGLGPGIAEVVERLTVRRGGRFRRERDGEPTYLPSGREPLLYAGSRRGVPHHAAAGHPSPAGPPPPPVFVAGLADRVRDFRREVWPLVAKDLAFAYYHELLTAHPERARMSWADFALAYAPEPWDGTAMRALIRRAVPRFEDRLNLPRLDHPLAGMRFGDLAGLQKWMHGYLAAHLARRSDAAHSADVALTHALRGVRGAIAGRVAPDPWFEGFSDHLTDTLPAERLAEIRAIAKAGVVTFLGADLRVDPHDPAPADRPRPRTPDGAGRPGEGVRRAEGARRVAGGGVWRAVGGSVPGAVTARAFVDATRVGPGLDRTLDPLVERLYGRGECAEERGLLKVRLPDRRIVDRTGTAHPRRFAFAPWTTGGTAHPAIPDNRLVHEADTLTGILLTETILHLTPKVA